MNFSAQRGYAFPLLSLPLLSPLASAACCANVLPVPLLARFIIFCATGSSFPWYLSLIFCFRIDASEDSSGMSVSPLHGRNGQSGRVHAFLSQKVQIFALFFL